MEEKKSKQIYITKWGEVVYELLYELPLSLSPSEPVIDNSPLVESRCSCSMTSVASFHTPLWRMGSPRSQRTGHHVAVQRGGGHKGWEKKVRGSGTPLWGCKCMGNEERGEGSWSGTFSLWARVKNSIATLTNLLWTIFWTCACHLARHANLHWLTSKLIPCNSFIMENDGRGVSIETAGSGASKEANERNSLNSWTKQIKYPFGIHATTMVQTLEKQ